MTSRTRSLLPLVGALLLAGCGEPTGPLRYVRNDRLADELKVKPRLRDEVAKVVDQLFGPHPREIRVPKGAGLRQGGRYLANHVRLGEQASARVVPIVKGDALGKPLVDAAGNRTVQEGGYALYRRHCQHCHGSSGDGNGPTAEFLYPHPRDYRKGLFKFTSTASNQKPTLDDLRKTINYGLHGTSMPAFEALMTPHEIEQVIDYVIFLSMRGEVETRLLTEASTAEEAEGLPEDAVAGSLDYVFGSWKTAPETVVDPPINRVEPTPASVVRGRDLFWKSDCLGCHGPKAQGNGQSFVDEHVFLEASFRRPALKERLDEAEVLGVLLAQQKARDEKRTPDRLPEDLRSIAGPNYYVPVRDLLRRLEYRREIRREGPDAYRVTIDPGEVEKWRKLREAWLGSLDDWGRPLRPANLNRGVYKGGRRPIDLYWRIAKGINGAKMPAHQLLKPEETWDLVNFVLALPYEPQLLQGTPPPPPEAAPATTAEKVAGR